MLKLKGILKDLRNEKIERLYIDWGGETKEIRMNFLRSQGQTRRTKA